MRLRIIFGIALVIVAIRPVLQTEASSSCSEALINALKQEQIFERLIACAVDKYFTDVASCLTSPPIVVISPSDCLACFSAFVEYVARSAISEDSASIQEDCIGLNRTDQCIFNAHVSAALFEFHVCSGFSMTYPGCSAQDIRAQAFAGSFTAVAEASLGNRVLFESLGLQSTECANCYFQATNYLVDVINANSTLAYTLAHCATLLNLDSHCLFEFAGFFSFFRSCSGWDITRTGPECTKDINYAIEGQNPYEILTTCAYNPDEPACDSVETYLEGISKMSNADCASCYAEYYLGLTESLAVYSVGTRCESISSSDCQAWNSEQIARLGNCTGFPVLI